MQLHHVGHIKQMLSLTKLKLPWVDYKLESVLGKLLFKSNLLQLQVSYCYFI